MRIKEILQEKGITAKQLAEMIGMTQTGLSIALSEDGNPPLKRLRQIAEALDVPVWQLFVSPEEISDAFLAVVRSGCATYTFTDRAALKRFAEGL